MSNNTPSIKEIKAIAEWANLTNDIREISLKVGDVELFMSRNDGNGQVPVPAAPVAEPVPAAAAPAPAAESAATAPVAAPAAAGGVGAKETSEEGLAAGEVLVKAPMVGTFYAAPRPGAPAFVSPGDSVREDTVLGIVEVMKLMNNLEAKVSGIVSRILVENGQAVEYGQPLMVIQSDA